MRRCSHRRVGCPCLAMSIKHFSSTSAPERKYHFEYELDIFDNGLVVPSDNAYHLPVFLGSPAMPVARWWHNHVPRIVPGNKKSIYMETIIRLRAATTEGPTRDDSPWIFQSWRYFDDCGDEIRERISQLTAAVRVVPRNVCKRIQPGRWKHRTACSAWRLHVARATKDPRPGHATVLRKVAVAVCGGWDSMAQSTWLPIHWGIVRKEFAGMGEFHPYRSATGYSPV